MIVFLLMSGCATFSSPWLQPNTSLAHSVVTFQMVYHKLDSKFLLENFRVNDVQFEMAEPTFGPDSARNQASLNLPPGSYRFHMEVAFQEERTVTVMRVRPGQMVGGIYIMGGTYLAEETRLEWSSGCFSGADLEVDGVTDYALRWDYVKNAVCIWSCVVTRPGQTPGRCDSFHLP